MGELLVLSRSAEPFADRTEAGGLLAAALAGRGGPRPLILGIPRGGLVLAAILARELGGELDLALARKLRAPHNPELAIGAMSEDGQVVVDEQVVRYLHLTPEMLARQQALAAAEIAQRQQLYRAVCTRLSPAGRQVVVTDDGLATGATMRAALLAARREAPARLLCAVPVGAETAVAELAELADELVCLRVPHFFSAVGQFYLCFTQVEDEEVLQLLAQQGRPPAGRTGGGAR